MVKHSRNFLRLRHAKAHDDGTLKNPLFLKIKTPKWRIGLGIVLGTVFLVACGIGITYIPIFQLRSVNIRGVVTLDPSALSQSVWESMRQSRFPFTSETNIYSVRLATLADRLSQQYPLQSVTIRRNGQEFDIDVVERITTIALRTKEKTVMLDVSGVYIRDATTEESRAIDIRMGSATPLPEEYLFPLQVDMPIVVNTKNDPTPALSAQKTLALLTLSEQLPMNGLHAVAFFLDGIDAPFVRIDTTAEYDLYVDIATRSITEQMDALRAVIAADTSVLPDQYIDLRFGAYVYTK